jgi:hypothetical protein
MAGQRTVVKHSYLTTKDKGFDRSRAHVDYIQFRAGRDKESGARTFFDSLDDDIYNKELKEAISRQNSGGCVIHKLILSPGVPGADAKEYTREVMEELGSKKGLDLEWYAVEHNNTKNPHCHIVIMGKDKNGRIVRLHKTDYEFIKDAGDRYLERNQLLDREEKSRVKEKEKQLDQRIVVGEFCEKLKLAARMFGRANGREEKEVQPKTQKEESPYQKRKREKQEEREFLGEDVDPDKKLLHQQRREERQKAEKERAWKEYCKPVVLHYPLGDGSTYPVPHDRANSLEALKQLEGDYTKGKQVARGSLSKDDHERLKSWISEKETDKARTELQARKVSEISIAIDSETEEKWSCKSSLADLRRLEKLSNSGQVCLGDVDTKALANWINACEHGQPIDRQGMGKHKDKETRFGSNEIVSRDGRVFDKETPLAKLHEFQQELTSGESENRLSKQDYGRLSSWIDTKERYGDDVYARREEKEQRRRRTNQERYASKDREEKEEWRELPRRKLSAMDKRIELAMRQQKAIWKQTYYSEKALERKRLEKDVEEAKWRAAAGDKPFLHLLNWIRQGVKALQKELGLQPEKDKEKAKSASGDKSEKDNSGLPNLNRKVRMMHQVQDKALTGPEELGRLKPHIDRIEPGPPPRPESKPESKPADKAENERKELDKEQKPLEDPELSAKPPDQTEWEPQPTERQPEAKEYPDTNKPAEKPGLDKLAEALPPEKPPIPIELQIEMEEAEELNRAYLAAEERSWQLAKETRERRMREEAEEEEKKRLELERLEWERVKGDQADDQYGDE